jgi:hypothetical protein
MLRDFANNLKALPAISPQRATNNTALVSSIIDLANFGGLTFVIATGTLADADATFVVLVEDGDDSGLSDAAAVADAYLIGTEAGAGFDYGDDDKVIKIGYIGPKRYVRLTVTPATNTGNADLSAVALLHGPRVLPQSAQQN